MLDTREEVIGTLKSLNDYYYVKSNFIICTKPDKSNIEGKDPFRHGFIDSIDIRKELINRLRGLQEKERVALLLFYTLGKPAEQIKLILHLSCRQFYRIKKNALEKVINFEK
jgi:DNA-directed RNA polymerase specialized sigma subunit